MKTKLLSQIKDNGLFYLLSIALISTVFIDPFSTGIISYLENQITSITLSLTLLLEFKALASTSSSSHIPLVSGISASTAEALTEAIKYLSWSDLLITSQLILITLSKTLLVKIGLIMAFLGSFLVKYRSLSLKVLVVILLINPGLPLYVTCIQHTAQEAKLDQGGHELAKELQLTHERYQKKEEAYKAKQQIRNDKQLEKANAKGKDRISLFNRIKDKTVDGITKAVYKVEEGFSDAYLVLKKVSHEIIMKTINLFTSILIQFIVLPFLFFYGLFTLFKKFLSNTVTNSFLKKIIILEATTAFVMIIISLI